MTKQESRRHYRIVRSEIEPETASTWSKQMAADLSARLRARSFSGVLFLYAALPGEPDLLSYLKSFLSHAPFHVALPRSRAGGEMDFFLWNPTDDLDEGSFGVREPKADALIVFPRAGDCAVVPALAVDKDLFRLGYGGGYYDRWLAEFKPRLGFVAAAVFPPCQGAAELPREPHDLPVDFCLKTTQSV